MSKTLVQAGYGVPIAIVIAGVLIAGAVFWAGNGGAYASDNFRMPSKADHVRGNSDAPIAIVEFSDLECSFCAQIHPTLGRIVEEQTDVKWIFRHFPLSAIHGQALSAAVASECIAANAGNDAFWSFTDAAFANQRQLGDAWYEEQAASFGIDAAAFERCMNDKKIVAGIQADLDEATGTGGRGTPYVVVVTPKGDLIPFSGALSYAQISAVIEQARNK